MTTIWRNGHFRAPSVEHFLDTLCAGLQEGRSVVMVMPNGTRPAELRRALTERVDACGWECHTLPLVEVASVCEAVQELTAHLQVRWEDERTPRTVENLLDRLHAQHAHGEIALFLDRFDALGEVARTLWLEVLKRWSSATHAIANAGTPCAALCLAAQAANLLPCLPESMLYLQVRWWWGLPAPIEVQLYCQSLVEPGEELAARLWRMYLLPHLVGDDVQLLHYLWDKLYCEPAELPALLAEYAAMRWPTRHDLPAGDFVPAVVAQAWQAGRMGELQRPETPPALLRGLWAAGMVSASVEYGMELHLAVAAQSGQRALINHRLWRGQAALLLPTLDQARLALCGYFTEQYGPAWPLQWGYPRDEEAVLLRENPLACEWRYLRELLAYNPVPREARVFKELVRQGLELRNRLAHYQPVSYAAFASFWREQRLLYAV